METSKLKDILDQHKLWLETNGMQGILAYLYGANLYGANLKDADLRRASLYAANLTGANLTDANLTDATLTDANLTGANLINADLWDANLTGAYLRRANLRRANLTGADLTGAYLNGADLTNAILPDVSWIIPGCLVQLNRIKYEFYLKKDNKLINFVQDSFGFFIQDNREEGTFDMLAGDRIIRNIPDWVKYSGLKQIESESV